MTTEISNTGRYVMYEPAVDSMLTKCRDDIQQFKAEQIQKLQEDCPYNLGSESGRLMAIKEIRSELSQKIEMFSHEVFQQAAKDIAFSIVSKSVMHL